MSAWTKADEMRAQAFIRGETQDGPADLLVRALAEIGRLNAIAVSLYSEVGQLRSVLEPAPVPPVVVSALEAIERIMAADYALDLDTHTSDGMTYARRQVRAALATLRASEPAPCRGCERARTVLDGLDQQIEAKHADMTRPPGGMRVPFHGDFVSATPSVLNRLRWWSRELRRALAPTDETSAALRQAAEGIE